MYLGPQSSDAGLETPGAETVFTAGGGPGVYPRGMIPNYKHGFAARDPVGMGGGMQAEVQGPGAGMDMGGAAGNRGAGMDMNGNLNVNGRGNGNRQQQQQQTMVPGFLNLNSNDPGSSITNRTGMGGHAPTNTRF